MNSKEFVRGSFFCAYNPKPITRAGNKRNAENKGIGTEKGPKKTTKTDRKRIGKRKEKEERIVVRLEAE